MSFVDGMPNHASPTTINSEHSNIPVPTDLQGNPITDEDNPAYLDGALFETKEWLKRTRKHKSFFEHRAVRVGHRTVVESKEAVPFISGLAPEPEFYSVDNPCPPTKAKIKAFDDEAAIASSPKFDEIKKTYKDAIADAIPEYTFNPMVIADEDSLICDEISLIIKNP